MCRRCSKKKCCKPKHIDLRVGSKNMLVFDIGSEIVQEDPLPVLPPIGDVFNYLVPDVVLTEETLARIFENAYQQMSRSDLMDTGGRLDAMATELARENLDIVGLQEVFVLSNNPLIYPDGTLNTQPYTANNGIAGDEFSPPYYQTFDMAQMLIDRLYKNHGVKYSLISYDIMSSIQSVRTKNKLEDAEASCNLTLGHAVIIKDSLKAKVLNQTSKPSEFARYYKDVEILVGDGTSGERRSSSYWLDNYGRGYIVVDLKIKGIPIRFIEVHAPSGNSLVSVDFPVSWQNNVLASNAQRAMFMIEILKQYIEPSPFPVIMVGDFNQQVVSEQDFMSGFSPSGMMSYLDKIAPDGSILTNTGKMIDTGFQIHGSDISGPEFKTAGFFGTCPPPFALWDCLRNPDGFFRFRIDHILLRRGDKTRALDWNVTLPEPLVTSPEQPWAWTSDHQGIASTIRICRK